LNKLGPEGSEVVARNARALGDLFATNFSESAARALDSAIEAVEDANQRVRQAIEQSNEAVESSVRQAISNVRSLGQQLGDDFSKLVDAGPLGRQIDALQAKLDKLRGQSNMDDLLEAQRKARLALREKEESIFVEGPITPSVQQDIDNFLAPERADLRRANQAITIARTETQLSSAEKAVQTLKDNTTKGIDDAIAQFENGTITLGELNATLARKLKLDAPLYKAAGKTLGAAFQRDFSRHLNTIRAQFDALRDAAAAGIDVKITVDDIAEPAVVQQEGVRNIRRAREDLADAIAAKSKAEARLRAAQKTNKLLQTQINIARNAARNKPKTKPKSVTETGPPKTGNLPGQRPVN
jgi:conjugal transfer/entry exclusion protein